MGGTKAFPDLGKHCQLPDFLQLDFLLFTCDSCSKVFCMEHKDYKCHDCPCDKNRRVVICETCAMTIEVTACNGDDEKLILEKHQKSEQCNPAKKKKPRCPVKRCREILSLSNSNTCKNCELTICIRHRFPAYHACKLLVSVAQPHNNTRFLLSLARRSSNDCAKDGGSGRKTSSPGTPTVKAH